MKSVSCKIETKGLASTLAKYAGATKRGLREVLEYASRQIAQNAQKETVLESQVAGGKKPKPTTAGQAEKMQNIAWTRRIKEERLPRKYILHPDRATHLRTPPTGKGSKKKLLAINEAGEKTTTQYFKEAKSRQGELASAWNATIFATRGKPVSANVKKRGVQHGSFKISQSGDTATAHIVAKFKKAGMEHIPALAIAQASHGMDKASSAIINRAFRDAKKAGRDLRRLA